jgi:hypothetical protein
MGFDAFYIVWDLPGLDKYLETRGTYIRIAWSSWVSTHTSTWCAETRASLPQEVQPYTIMLSKSYSKVETINYIQHTMQSKCVLKLIGVCMGNTRVTGNIQITVSYLLIYVLWCILSLTRYTGKRLDINIAFNVCNEPSIRPQLVLIASNN